MNLTAEDDRRFWHHSGYVWSPGGLLLAAGAGNALVVIEVLSGAITDVATKAPAPDGLDRLELRPLQWSPSGNRLLIQLAFLPTVDCYERSPEPTIEQLP